MGLTVSLGLKNFFFCTEQANWEAALRKIVETGVTELVRDIYSPSEVDPESKPKIYEAYRENSVVVGRYLPEQEASPILQAVNQAKADWGQSYASFSWGQLDEWGIGDVQDLALRFDDNQRKSELVRLTWPDGTPVRVISIQRSLRNWGDYSKEERVAAEMHQLAETFRLVVHSV